MKCQRNGEVMWTTLELGGLLEDEDSHVRFTRTTKHLALHPYHLNNIQRGLNQILRLSLNTYDRELKGFVLAFRNPKLLSNLGELLYDSPFIHIDIEADFYLFHPMVGSFLKGIVNKKGLDYIVILVHKIYTVSIPKPDNIEQWLGESVKIGQEIKCCVTQIHYKSKPPFICATLRSDYSQGCRLSESITNIDNVDSAFESTNSSMKIGINGIGINGLEDDGIFEKERKKHKFRDSNSEIVCKTENGPELNVKSDTSRIIKSEKKQQSMQDNNIGSNTFRNIKSEKKLQSQSTLSNTDDSLNNLEVDNIPRKHKKSKITSKWLLNNETIYEHTESCKAVKRENSILLDSITEIQTKRKKNSKKSKEFEPESVLKRIIKSEKKQQSMQDNNIESNTFRNIKSEKKLQSQSTLLNTDDSLNNLEVDNIPRKHKKSKITSKSLLNNETIYEHTESCKAIKRENSILLDSITEIQMKKKKNSKKSKEFEPESVLTKTENEEEKLNIRNTISYIKCEEKQHV